MLLACRWRCGYRPHQGLVLDVSPLEWHTLEVLPPPEELQQQLEGGAAGSTRHPVWLALDEVVDPVRSCDG